MKSIITSFLIFLGSIGSIIYLEKVNSINLEKTNYIKNLESFSNFWEIKLNKNLLGYDRIGFKEEEFSKQDKIYTFNYQFKKFTGLNLNIYTNIKGKIYFNENFNPSSLLIIIGDSYQLVGEKEENKLKLYLQKIGEKEKIISKILDLNKVNFDFFIFYLLPYYNLKIGQTYTYKTIDLLASIKENITFQEIYITRKNKNLYEIKIGGFTFKLKFKDNKLVYKSNNFFKEILRTKNIRRIKEEIIGKQIKKTTKKKLSEKINLEKEIEKIKKNKKVKYCPLLKNN